MKPLSVIFRAARRLRASLTFVVSLFVISAILTSFLAVYWLWAQQDRRNTGELVQELSAGIASDTRGRLAALLAMASAVVESVNANLRSEVVPMGSLAETGDSLDRLFRAVLFPRKGLQWMGFGWPNGDSIRVERLGGSLLQTNMSFFDASAHVAKQTIVTYRQEGGLWKVVESNSHVGDDFAPSRPWYQGAAASPDVVSWSQVYRFQQSGSWGVNASRAIRRLSGGIQGVVTVGLGLEELSVSLGESHRNGREQSFIVDAQGRLLAASDGSLAALLSRSAGEAILPMDSEAFPSLGLLARVLRHPAPREGGGVRPYEDTVLGQSFFVLESPLEPFSWRVMTLVSADEFVSSINARNRILSLVVGVIGILFSAAVYVFMKVKVTRPIESMLHALHRGEPPLADGLREIAEVGFSVRALLERESSARKRIEEQEERLAAILDFIGDAVFVVDGRERIRLMNKAAQELTGWDGESGLGSKLSVVLELGNPLTRHPDTTSAEAFSEWECRLRARDGDMRSGLLRKGALSGVTGGEGDSVVVFSDRSREHRALHDLKESRMQLRAFLDSISDVAWFKNRELRYVAVNRAMAEAAGKGEADVVGRSDVEIWSVEDASRFRLEDLKAIDGECEVISEETLGLPESRVRVETIRHPICDDQGNVTGIVGISRDITVRKMAEERLRYAMTRAEAASSAKSLFLANMSHEIRTPMNAIIGFSSLLAQEPLSPKMQKYLELIQKSGDHLVSVIDDILDVARIETGRLSPSRERFSLREVVSEVSTVVFAKASHSEVQCRSFVDERLPDSLVGDPRLVRQVLINLLGNAVKFTERGFVALEVVFEGERDGEVQVKFSISDSGKGISKGYLNRIFMPFTQEDESHTRRFGGSGLGLAIVKGIVDALGGTVHVASEVGVGSRFDVSLSFPQSLEARGPSPTESRASEGASPGFRILVVEDDTLNQVYVGNVLRSAGFEFDLTDSGDEAINMLRESPYALILMDIQLPNLDGCSVTRFLRSQGVTIPIVAMTAHAMPFHYEEAREAGMDDFLIKPFSQGELLRLIARYRAKVPSSS